MGYLIEYGFFAFTFWLVRRDMKRRDGVSGAIWIPTLWLGILASRPLSTWVGFGGGTDTLEGSPLDRLFFFGSIFAAFLVISRRAVNWPRIVSANWQIFFFYGYLLVSVLWADSPIVSFKRWFKDFGNISVALVVLSEVNPIQAFRAIFVRCGYLLIPLSYIFVRYFPGLGRRYSIFSGEMEATGVTFQKNSLGAMILITSLVIIWDLLERTPEEKAKMGFVDKIWPYVVLLTGFYLLKVCDSKTSMACLALGASIIASAKVPFIRKRVGAFGAYALIGGAAYYALDSALGLTETVVTGLGRDMTFTGRTDVWRELLALKTDPIIGTGFCSFWSDISYQSRLPEWIAFSAHNGYLEMFIDGGYICIGFLVLMLLATGFKINRGLATGNTYQLMRFAVLVAVIIGDMSESHYARMTPLWFMFLLTALQPVPSKNSAVSASPGRNQEGEPSNDPVVTPSLGLSMSPP